MRNITEIRFSDTTGNGKFSGKPDLPSEIFFLGTTCIVSSAYYLKFYCYNYKEPRVRAHKQR